MVDFVKAGADGAIERHRALEARVRALEAMFQMPGGGGYASLTGPGETATPGDLTQEGGLLVDDSAGHGVNLASSGGGIGLTDASTVGTYMLELDPAGGISLHIQAGPASTGFIYLQDDGAGGIRLASVSGGVSLDGGTGGMFFLNVPTSDPLVSGQVWSNGGVLTLSP